MNYAPLLVKLLSSAAGSVLSLSPPPAPPPFPSLSLAQFPVLNFQKRVAEVTRFSRETSFFGNCDFSHLHAGRRNDLPRRQTASESFPAAADAFVLADGFVLTCSRRFSGLLPRLPNPSRIDATVSSQAEANQNVVHTSSMHRSGSTQGENRGCTGRRIELC